MRSGIKIAIGGKGGVGKTTVCAVWSQLFAQEGHEVLAIDADPSLSLHSAFGVAPERRPKPLIEMKELIAQRTGARPNAFGAYFRLNPNVSDIPEEHSLTVAGVRLLVLGGITQAGAGCACPEGAFLKALLAHTVLHREEVVLVDLAAGVEFMGRASVQGIDAFVVVVEPGSRSIETARHIAAMATDLGVGSVGAIANKVTQPAQMSIIESELAEIPLLGSVSYSSLVQEADLKRSPVLQADAAVLDELNRARQQLLWLIGERSSGRPAAEAV